MEETLLSVRDLEVLYHSGGQTVHAVNSISLDIQRGKTLGLVGETGAGKTTTAFSIMRLLPERSSEVKSGSIVFDGQELSELSEVQMSAIRGEKISMIFQDPMSSLNPVLSVGEQIAEAIRLHNHDGLDKRQIERRVGELLQLVGIPEDRKKEFPHQFSGGMRQRVVIAMALACNPELLIADEPTTALDVTIQAQVLRLMKKLRDETGTSLLMITHDLGIIAEMCDDVAVMYAGKIVEKGSVEDIFEGDRHHPYTEGLFGSIPKLDDERERLSPIPGLMPDPSNLPSGCSFHPRCAHCMEICKTTVPPVIRENGHEICCHLFSAEDKET